MKKLFFLILCAVGMTANAQEDYNRVRLEFNPSTLSYHGINIDMGKTSLTGGTIGYEHGFALSDYHDCYLVAGAKLQYLYKSKVRPYRIDKGYMDTRITNRAMDIMIPVNFMYRFWLSDQVAIEPYAGLNATCYIFGKEKLELAGSFEETLDIFDKDEMQEYGWEEAQNRLLIGWQAGADLLVNDTFTVGFSYGTDFTDFGNDSHWTHWSLGVGFCF